MLENMESTQESVDTEMRKSLDRCETDAKGKVCLTLSAEQNEANRAECQRHLLSIGLQQEISVECARQKKEECGFSDVLSRAVQAAHAA